MRATPAIEFVEATWRIEPREGMSSTEYLLYRRHRFAYEEACRRAPQGRVAVDLACGLGYGASLFLARGWSVTAIDLATQPLRQLHVSSALSLLQADAIDLPLRSASADLFVSFQLIEHMPTSSALRTINEIRRVLKPDGCGFLTTPNARWRLLPGQRPWNPFHVCEYRPRGIETLCRRAGLSRDSLWGVMGLHGAQEAELARVHQDPLRIWGGGLGRRARGFIDRFQLGDAAQLQREPTAAVQEADDSHHSLEWFTLSRDYASGLDFWIEVRP